MIRAKVSDPKRHEAALLRYAIQVEGVVRYIGKGSNGRELFHAIEARRINSRWARGANTTPCRSIGGRWDWGAPAALAERQASSSPAACCPRFQC